MSKERKDALRGGLFPLSLIVLICGYALLLLAGGEGDWQLSLGGGAIGIVGVVGACLTFESSESPPRER